MTAFAGLLSLTGAPADPGRLHRMTTELHPPGDTGGLQATGSACLGQWPHQAGAVPGSTGGPRSLDGRTWLVADARVDGQAELRRELLAADVTIAAGASDADLILHAYEAWGVDCVQHLIGDFAFALWDIPRGRLLLARDHFGVRPLYYSLASGELLFSGNLAVLRRHPAVSAALDDLAVTDFMLHTGHRDFEATVFRDIRRLPPAHVGLWEAGNFRILRYWALPIEEPLAYPRADDFVDAFRMHFTAAVTDRLRTERMAVSMTGGMDSSSVAATARDPLLQRGGELRAYTIVYDRLIPDRERAWSTLVADHLGLPITHLAADDYEAFQAPIAPMSPPFEPFDGAFAALSADLIQLMRADGCRAMLSGDGGDPLLYPEPTYVPRLLRRGQLRQLARALALYHRETGHRPPLYLRSAVRAQLRRTGNSIPPLPEWLHPRLAIDPRIVAHWRDYWSPAPSPHPWRPAAYDQFSDPLWASMFESHAAAPGPGMLPVAFPFFDVRLVRFALRLPPVPWCVAKHLLRRAMHGMLPPAVLARPKSPLAGRPVHARGMGWEQAATPAPELAHFLSAPALAEIWAKRGLATRRERAIISVNAWLAYGWGFPAAQE